MVNKLEKRYVSWQLDPKKRKPLLSDVDTDRYYRQYPDGDPKVLGVIQAWKRSTRFPNKIYAQIGGAPLLYHTINRLSVSSYISTAMVASPEELDVPEGVDLFIHKEALDKDVLSLYYFCAKERKPRYVVRITSDCPSIDPLLIDYVVHQAVVGNADYCSNVLYPLSFPDGQDIEVMSYDLLEFLHHSVKSKAGREHVTWEFRQNMKWQKAFKTISITNVENLSKIKCSVDTPDDLKNLEKLGLV